jgi:DNA-3-methyladenine glycosylase
MAADEAGAAGDEDGAHPGRISRAPLQPILESPAVPSFRPLPRSFYRRSAESVASELLGRYLVREASGVRLALRIVETEAYLGAEDPAAHTFGGRRTARVRSMYLGGGHAYVYFVYGMHFCLNVVAGEIDSGTAVLLRAGVPVEGEAAMLRNRGLAPGSGTDEIAGGPARLCRALGIDRRFDGATLWRGELRVVEGDPPSVSAVQRSPRIGVAYAGEAAAWPLRFTPRATADPLRPVGPRGSRSV